MSSDKNRYLWYGRGEKDYDQTDGTSGWNKHNIGQSTTDRDSSGNGNRWNGGRWKGNSGKENEGKDSGSSQYGTYEQSDLVSQAYNQLQQNLASKPGAYESSWQAQLNDTINRIMNREKFNYDLNGDALYQQYKDQYTTQGQMAMMDTMGMAAAMTGGYGNSYAQSVGQQAYQGYLQQLNDKVPELYQMALDKYNNEGQQLLNQYSILGAQEEMDYGRYRDTVGDWNTAVDRAQNQYYAERAFDYGKFSDDRAFNYQTERDKALDAQWQAEFNEAIRQFQLQWDAEHGADDSGGGSSGGGSGGGSSGGGSGGGSGGSDAYTEQEYQTIKSSGATKSELNDYLKEGLKTGNISQEEARFLRNATY